jgi:4-hydroxy-tetrahydrodipicolinate reductase
VAVSGEPLKVIQWGTGHAGQHALRNIIQRPDLELVGVHAHSPAKIGRDAAELCGLAEPTGVIATGDAEALLASDADCVSYMAMGESRIDAAIDDLCAILASGKNVVNTSVVFLVNPAFLDDKLRGRLTAACERGGSTLFTSGIDPGWSGDLLPLVMSQMCEHVDSVRVSELMDYSGYNDPDFTGATFGYGKPLDYEAALYAPGALTFAWGGMIQLVAQALGWTVEDFREEHERLPAPDTFTTAMGEIAEGTTAGVRFELQGIVNGRPAVVAAHVNRLRGDIGPDWPSLSGGRSGYRIEVVGRPSFTMELEPHIVGGDHNEAGIIGTAMRLINAIPVVCAAPPGLVTPLDLPVFAARGALRFAAPRH